MTIDELLSLLNEGYSRKLCKEDVLASQISLPVLKRIDKIFCKGLNYYQDFAEKEVSNRSSVFFRKQNFVADLNLETRRIVDRFEGIKCMLDGLAVLSDMNLKTDIKRCKISDSPKVVAHQFRNQFIPEKRPKNPRALLVDIIAKCSDINLFVFEYVETWNKKEKSNVDGFFLNPNMIVLKRQKSYKREIFTLAHEIGHFLLGEEEVESLDLAQLNYSNLSRIERWCNDFAFYLILGDYSEVLDSIEFANSENDYCHDLVEEIVENTYISSLAVYTRLLFDRKISAKDYEVIKEFLNQNYLQKLADQKAKYSESGSHGCAPKPIISPLYLETMQMAMYKGLVTESQFCKQLSIPPSNLEKYLC